MKLPVDDWGPSTSPKAMNAHIPWLDAGQGGKEVDGWKYGRGFGSEGHAFAIGTFTNGKGRNIAYENSGRYHRRHSGSELDGHTRIRA